MGKCEAWSTDAKTRWDSVLGLLSSYLNAGDDYIEGVIADISDRNEQKSLYKRVKNDA